VVERLSQGPTTVTRPGHPFRQPGSGTQLGGIQPWDTEPPDEVPSGLRSELRQVSLHAAGEDVDILDRQVRELGPHLTHIGRYPIGKR
jgi:hypothetical protein